MYLVRQSHIEVMVDTGCCSWLQMYDTKNKKYVLFCNSHSFSHIFMAKQISHLNGAFVAFTCLIVHSSNDIQQFTGRGRHLQFSLLRSVMQGLKTNSCICFVRPPSRLQRKTRIPLLAKRTRLNEAKQMKTLVKPSYRKLCIEKKMSMRKLFFGETK